MIQAICILYFRKDEIFHVVKNNEIKLSENKKIITKISNDKCWNNSNFGIKIPSETDSLYLWSLRINKCEEPGVLLGIGSSDQTVNTAFSDNGYFFCGGLKYTRKCVSGWSNYCKCQGFKEGDNVSIHLDLRKSEIKLIINGKDQGVAFENIAKSKEITYHMFVTLRNINDSVEIVDFTQK